MKVQPTLGVCLVVALLAWAVPASGQAAAAQAPPTAPAQEDHEAHHPPDAAPEPATPATAGTSGMPGMQGMQGMQQMMGRMKEMEAELAKLVATMDAANGDAKVSAMADVVKALVRRQSMMCEGMMQMHGSMMKN